MKVRSYPSLLLSLALLALVSCKTTSTDPNPTPTSGSVTPVTTGSTFTYTQVQNGTTSTLVHTIMERGVTYQGMSNTTHVHAVNGTQTQEGYIAYDATGDLQLWAPLDMSNMGLTPSWVRFPFMSGTPFHLSQTGDLGGQPATVTYDVTKTTPSTMTIKGVTYTTQTAHLVMTVGVDVQGQTMQMANAAVDYAFVPELGYIVKSSMPANTSGTTMEMTLVDYTK